MKLKTASAIAFFSLAYFFLFRGIGTICSSLFVDLTITRIGLSLAFLASIGLLLFFVSFLTLTDEMNLKSLGTATGWAIFGSACISFLYFREALKLFKIDFLREVIFSSRMENLIPFIPVVGSASILIFFVVFSRQEIVKDKSGLKKVVNFALMGATASFLLRIMIAINFLLTREGRWFSDLTGSLAGLGIILLIISFIGLGYFFSHLARKKPGF